jgi:hypothetical protein
VLLRLIRLSEHYRPYLSLPVHPHAVDKFDFLHVHGRLMGHLALSELKILEERYCLAEVPK